MPLPLLALAAAPSVIKGVAGIADIIKGNRRAKGNKFPMEQVNAQLQENAAIAQNMARTGLPQQQYNNSFNNIMRNQSGALASFARNPRGTNLASILRASNDATMGLDAADASARVNNQRFSLGQNQVLANEQNRVWDWNRRQRYINEAQSISQQIGSGKQNAFGALNDLSQLGQLSVMGNQGNSTNPQGSMAGIMSGYVSGNPLERMLRIGRQRPQSDLPMLNYTMGGGI